MRNNTIIVAVVVSAIVYYFWIRKPTQAELQSIIQSTFTGTIGRQWEQAGLANGLNAVNNYFETGLMPGSTSPVNPLFRSIKLKDELIAWYKKFPEYKNKFI